MAFQVVASWAFSMAVALGGSALAVLTLGLRSRTLMPRVLRFWGKTMLAIAGIRLDLHGAEHLSVQYGKVAVFNHGSILDAFLVTAVMPDGGVAAIKREALYYPVVGLGLYCMGFLIIDRGDSVKAKRTLRAAAARLARERLTVFIAPEGTRSHDGVLLPFKRGAFHLAIESAVPVVPVVISGASTHHPYGRWWSQPGVVRIDVLAPMSTVGLTVTELPALVERVRAAFVAELAVRAAAAVV